MSSYLEFMKALQAAGNIADTFANMKTLNDSIIINERKLEKANLLKNDTYNKQLNVQNQITQNQRNVNESNKNLEEMWKRMELHGVAQQNFPTIGAQFKSDDYQDLLKEHEATLTDDLLLTVKAAEGWKEQLKRNRFEEEHNNKLISSLNQFENDMFENVEHMKLVGTIENNKGLKDKEDIQTYIDLPENESTYKEPDWIRNGSGEILVSSDGVPISNRNEDGDVIYSKTNNYMATNLLHPKKKGTIFGHAPVYQKADITASQKLNSLSTNIRSGFDGLKRQQEMMIEAGMVDEVTLAELGLLDLHTLKGDSKTWDDEENISSGKVIIQDAILSIFDNVSEFPVGGEGRRGWEFPSDLQADFIKAKSDPAYANIFVAKLYKKWIRGPLITDTNTGLPVKSPSGDYTYGSSTGVTGKWNKEYDEDGPSFDETQYLGRNLPPGTTQIDDFVHSLFRQWNYMDQMYPGLGRSMFLDEGFMNTSATSSGN